MARICAENDLRAIHEPDIFKISHHFLTVGDRIEIIQLEIKERREIIIFPVLCNRVHDLIEIQILEELWRW